MAKFKNETGFNQVVIIGGKKRLVRKEGVIEAHDDFIQTGFKQVPDDTPITTRASTKVVSDRELQGIIDGLNERISDLEERLDNDETMSEMEEKLKVVSEKALELEDGASKDLTELRDFVDKLNESVTNQGGVLKVVKETQDDKVLRRMEILKTAMQAMEMQIDEVTGYGDAEGN